MPAPDLTITPVRPSGPAVQFHLWGDAIPSDSSSGNTGWVPVDRPRRESYTEWMGQALYQMDLPLALDLSDDNGSVEGQIKQVKAWREAATTTGEPPLLTVHGPVPLTDLKWTLKSLAWGAALRRPDGHIMQQALTLTLLEYQAADLAFTSPAKRAQKRQSIVTAANPGGGFGSFDSGSSSSGSSNPGGGFATIDSGTGSSAVVSPNPGGGSATFTAGVSGGGHRTYTVRSGDTLDSIAARQLGNWRRWTELAGLNSIRDPRALRVGQVLRLP